LVATDVRLVQRHDAVELVKIRYNFARVVLAICEYCFRSFTGTAESAACGDRDAMRLNRST